MDTESGPASSHLRVQGHQGKSTRFQVKKLYEKLQNEVLSHIENGNTQVAIRLVTSRRSEINNPDEAGVTILMSVASRGNIEVTRALLEEGAQVNTEDNDLWTPLMYAARDGHEHIVRELLDAGADSERRDVGGWTALMWSCYKGHVSSAEMLITHYANINIKAMHNMTCLHWAAGRGHSEVVDLLLKNGAKVDATDKYGSTPLIWASRKGYLDIVEMLLSSSASSDAVGMYSWTPLLVSLQGGHADVADRLVRTQPNLNVTDKIGMTALALAAKAGYVEIVRDLLDQGAYLNVVDKSGDTILHHSVRGGHTEIINLLLRKNPDIDARGQDNKTVLNLAVEKGYAAVVKLILSKDPDKEMTDKDGNTPLLRAVRARNIEMAYILLEKGAKVAAADSKGDTCLHIAMRTRNRRMLECILKNPRNSRYLYVRNNDGETAYSIDNSQRKSILSHIFGAKQLNSQIAVESQLGYELYSSALADILSSPSLSTPMTVGLYAKWGSGKSFMLNKLKEDMKAYMRHSPAVYFEFSWLIFIINFTICAFIGLIVGLLHKYYTGLAVGFALFVFFYTLQGALYCTFQHRNWDWVVYISHSLAKKLQKIRLILYLLFYNRPPPLSEETQGNCISFLFAESTKLTSLGGEQSLASMIGSLFDALEKKYGTLVTRLYKVYGTERERGGRYKKLCCIPYFIIVLFVILSTITLIGLVWVHYQILTSVDNMKANLPISLTMLILAIVFLLGVLTSLGNLARSIAAYANSPKRRTMRASQSLDVSKSDNFLHLIKEEVEFLSSLVTTMDRHESWQTRLVLIIDGLDSCEQEKVLQVLDAINLIIPEKSPFIILLALDPHVIIKGIEANQLKGMHDPSLNGYGYLRNIVHLPFYLQNHGLPRMLTNTEGNKNRWRNSNQAPNSKQKVAERQASAVSSTMSLAETPQGRKGRRGSLPPESSLATLEPLQQFIGEMPKNIMKNDYFVDINPRSMRRLMNIIAMAGRLLRANDIEYNWYRLSAWINITEQWPYRTSWILLYYEEMEGKLDENLSLLSIYEIVKERMVRDTESLLEIDRNEKKFTAFLKSHVPKLCVEDIKRFMPSTINLDPYLRKIIKEKMKDQESYLQERGFISSFQPSQTIGTLGGGTLGGGVDHKPLLPANRIPVPACNHGMGGQYPQQLWPSQPGTQSVFHPAYTDPQNSPPRLRKIPKMIVKSLSHHTVTDVSELMVKIPGLSSLNINSYKASVLLHNITGLVLADCELTELRSVLEMKFGDWQLFKNVILAMREVDISPCSSVGDLTSNSSTINYSPAHPALSDHRPNLNSNNINHIQPLRSISSEGATRGASVEGSSRSASAEGEGLRSVSARTSISSSLASSPTLKNKAVDGKRQRRKRSLTGGYSPRPDQSVETVRLENQMIADALHEQLSSSTGGEDEEDSGSQGGGSQSDSAEGNHYSTVRHMPQLAGSLLNNGNSSESTLQHQQNDMENVSCKSVKFSVLDETRDTSPFVSEDHIAIEMSRLNTESRSQGFSKAKAVTSLPAIAETEVGHPQAGASVSYENGGYCTDDDKPGHVSHVDV